MKRRRASSSGTVSLFPFLAVLVCAMGALILLLLVTTRRIRQQSLAEVLVSQPIDRIDSQPAPLPGIDPAPSPPTAPAPDPREQPLLPLLAADPPPVPHDPTPALLAEAATLEARQLQLAREVAQREQELARIEVADAAQSQTFEQQQNAAAEHAAEKERLNNLYLRLRQQQDETRQRVDDLRRQIQQTRAQQAEADSKFAIIPYDGHSGTTRRPIIIECTADRLTFVSEGISLTARDLEGFPPRYNPVLYVTQALVRYWERQQRSDTDLGKPYVLLVVRPGGTTGYYVARGMLGPMGDSFGYELVGEEQQFAWPHSDAEAITICRTIIDKMNDERDTAYDVLLQGGRHRYTYHNDRGEFELDEIERLRNPLRDSTVYARREDNSSRTDVRLSESANPAAAGSYSGRRAPAGDPGDDAAPRGVYKKQNSAVTQQDRMPEWLREGTTRTQSPQTGGSTTGISDVDPFAEPGEPAGTDSSLSTVDPAAPRRLEVSREGAGKPTPVDVSQPQWGPRAGSGIIGFEKEVRVEVTPTEITIGTQSTLYCDSSTPAADLKRLIVGGLNREVRNWGAPPKSFYWMPAVRFAVSPGGRPQYERLKRIIREWDVPSTVQDVPE